jgi:hypothetical protein
MTEKKTDDEPPETAMAKELREGKLCRDCLHPWHHRPVNKGERLCENPGHDVAEVMES